MVSDLDFVGSKFQNVDKNTQLLTYKDQLIQLKRLI